MNWVSVSDRVPRQMVPVLCYYRMSDYEYFTVGMVVTDLVLDGVHVVEWVTYENYDAFKPSHWMRLEPPK